MIRVACRLAALGLWLGLAAPATAQTICADTGSDAAAPAPLAGLIDRAGQILDDYPSLGAAWRDLSPELCLSDAASVAHGLYEVESNRITIDRALSPDFQLAVLFHEVRHMEQVARGICPDLGMAMGEYARATWALEADAAVAGLILTWKMREDGEPGPWAALADWPTQRDLAHRFEAVMLDTGDVAAAAEAAFVQWYADAERRESYYIASCSNYLARLDESHALPRYQLVPEGFFDALCVLPDGTPFSCTEPQGVTR